MKPKGDKTDIQNDLTKPNNVLWGYSILEIFKTDDFVLYILYSVYFCNVNLFVSGVPQRQQGENCLPRGGFAIPNLEIEIHRNKSQKKEKSDPFSPKALGNLSKTF